MTTPQPYYPPPASDPQQAPRPGMPAPVRMAFRLMLAVTAIFILCAAASLVTYLVLGSRGELGDGQVGAALPVSVVFLIPGALWTGLAFANRAGHSWARVVATCLAGILIVQSLAGISVGFAMAVDVPGVGLLVVAAGMILLILAVATVVLLWNRQSAIHFHARRTQPQYWSQVGYADPAPAGYPQEAGTPAHGGWPGQHY